MNYYPIALAVVLGTLALTHGVGRCDDDAARRFLADYSKPTRYFADCQRGHECRVDMTNHQIGGKQIFELECVSKINGFCIRMPRVRKTPDNGPVEMVDYGMIELGNEAYLGMLRTSGPGHAITTLEVYPDRKYTTSPFFYSGVLETHVHKPYDDAVRSSAVTVEQYVRSEESDGRELARLRLSMMVDYPNIKGVKLLNDYYFDPRKNWVCVMIRKRSQSKPDDQIYEETRLLPRPDAGESDYFPRGIEMYSVNEKAQKRELTRSYMMSEVKSRKVDDAEIRLTQFGLPEPVGVVWAKPIPLYVWFLSAAGGLALISVVCRWLLRRRTKVAPSPIA